MLERQKELFAPLLFSQYLDFVWIVCQDDDTPAVAPSPETPIVIEAEFLKEAELYHSVLIISTVLSPLYTAETCQSHCIVFPE